MFPQKKLTDKRVYPYSAIVFYGVAIFGKPGHLFTFRRLGLRSLGDAYRWNACRRSDPLTEANGVA